MFTRIINSHYTNTLMALILMLSAIQEFTFTFDEIGVHHGAFIYSLHLLLKSFTGLVEGARYLVDK